MRRGERLRGRVFRRWVIVDQPELYQRQVRNQDPDREVDEHRAGVLEAEYPWRHRDPDAEDTRDPFFPFPECDQRRNRNHCNDSGAQPGVDTKRAVSKCKHPG